MPDENPNALPPPSGELAREDTSYTSGYLGTLIPKDKILRERGAGNLEIYREVLRDDQCKSTFQQRRLAVVSKEWGVMPGGGEEATPLDVQAAEALKAQLERINLDEVTDQMLYGNWYGWSVAEIMWGVQDGLVSFDAIKVRRRERFRFDLDRNLYLMKDGLETPMPPRKFWTLHASAEHSDDPYGLGLAHYCYWPVFFKRNGIKFWMVFLEKFGAPTVKGTVPKPTFDNEAERAKVLAALRAFAQDTVVVVPDGTVVELLEAARSGASDYDTLHEAMDRAIAKIVLSQTMTTDNGSSRSQAEVHEGVRDEVVKADADLVCESFNRGPVTWWTEYNFPGARPPRLWRKIQPEKDLKAQVEIDKGVYELGYEPDEEYIRKTYGEGWKKREKMVPPAGGGLFGNDPEQQAAFAELAQLLPVKARHRMDQQALLEAAIHFANHAEGVVGQRVKELLEMAEASDDYDTFRKRLNEVLAAEPSSQTAGAVQRGGVVARLLASLTGQR